MEERADVKFSIPYVKVFKLQDRNEEFLHEGQLQICHLKQQDIYFLNIENVYQTIYKEMQIIKKEFKIQTTFVFYYENSFIALIIDNFHVKLLKKFQDFINSQCQIISEEQSKNDVNLYNLMQSHCPYVFQHSLISQSSGLYYLQEGSIAVNKGFKFIGKAIGSGISTVGTLISSKVSKNQTEARLAPSTEQKIEKVYQTKNKTITVAKSTLTKILKPIDNGAKIISNGISQKMTESNIGFLKGVRNVYRATLNATGTALGGLVDGTSEVGKSIGSSTRKIVDKKYGNKLSQGLLAEKPRDNQLLPIDQNNVNHPD